MDRFYFQDNSVKSFVNKLPSETSGNYKTNNHLKSLEMVLKWQEKSTYLRKSKTSETVKLYGI